MHSPFTFNPNAHRAPSNYQQQSGHHQPVYNIGAPLSGFMSHPNHFMNHHSFTRSFASVVSCENDLANRQHQSNVNKANNCHSNNSSGLLNSFMKHFNNKPTVPQYQTVPPQNKEFEDFIHMPSLPAHNYINHPLPPHFYQQPPSNHINMKIPIISGQFYPQSAQIPSANNNIPTTATRSFMESFFGYQRQQPKPKNQRWFGRGFRCGRGGKQWKNPKLQEKDVNLQKNIHEKERTSIERDIQDDSCDFVHVEEKDVAAHVECDKKQTSSNNPNETAKGSCDDPPFMIYSLEEFPVIVATSAVVSTLPPPAQSIVQENCEEGFVVLPSEASISTPTFVPRRFTLCQKLEQIVKTSPTRINGYLKPCLKKPCQKLPRRRTYSECSDDFVIEFASGSEDHQPQADFIFSDDDSDETDSDDDDDIDVNGREMTEIAEEDDESSEEEADDEVDSPEQQLDSGVEEKRVRFNMTPKVHVMRVWNSAYRLCRKGDFWIQFARDNERFKNRISLLRPVLSPVLSAEHRQRVYRERFQQRE